MKHYVYLYLNIGKLLDPSFSSLKKKICPGMFGTNFLWNDLNWTSGITPNPVIPLCIFSKQQSLPTIILQLAGAQTHSKMFISFRSGLIVPVVLKFYGFHSFRPAIKRFVSRLLKVKTWKKHVSVFTHVKIEWVTNVIIPATI